MLSALPALLISFPAHMSAMPSTGAAWFCAARVQATSSKLTVSFPGYGQKKLIEKYAALEKA